MSEYAAYVGTYTREDNIGLHILGVDVEKGTFVPKRGIEMENPAHLCLSSSGKYLYCTTDLGVAAFRIEKDGALHELNQRWIGGIRGCFLSTDEEDSFLFVAGYYDGRVTVMHLKEDGSVGEIADAVFHKGIGKSVGRRNTSPHVNCVLLTPDQKFLCAVDNGLDCVKVYEFDHSTGTIELADIIHLPLESAPRHMVFSADGKYAYIICELSSEIMVYSYCCKERGPQFERIQSLPSKDPEARGASAGSELALTPDEKYLLTSNAGINTASIFRRDAKTGLLTYLGSGMVGGHYPKSIAVFPDGEHFASLNYDSDEISFFHFVNGNECFLECAKPISIESPNACLIVDLSVIEN